MPLFLSSEEYQNCSHDASLVAEKADAFIRELMNQLETVKAQADAASITAEQTCSLLEQKYVSLKADFSCLQSQHSQLNATLEERLAEVTQLQRQINQINMLSIGKDGDIERLSTETMELHKSKRQLMELLEQKDLEISEKNSTIKSYLDKIVTLTENAASKEARLSDLETELAQSQACCARISQEKELVERHNSWLNDELKIKVDNLIELRKTHSELEAEMSVKLSDGEKRWNENSSALKWNKDRVRELESKLASLEQELILAKDAAAATEKQFSAEISTLTKLVELYKESSEEWSKKAGELEGVIKALETHLSQAENDNKERLEQEVSARKEIEKDANCLKEKLDQCLAELENLRKTEELKLLPSRSFASELLVDSIETSDIVEEDRILLRNVPVGISGTALAASLLRDGWSLAKLYTKYQEAVDALRHEQLGRKQSQAILERVLHEIEEKAGVILDERVEHERTIEAYSALDQKLQHSLSERTTLQGRIQELKADLRRKERESASAQKEIADLQNQVSVLLKECQDIQLRCGSIRHDYGDALAAVSAESPVDEYDTPDVIPGLMLAFKDINGLVEQNVQLRRLVHTFSEDIASRETELKEKYERELQKHTDEASSKVNAVLARAEEQQHMIESLHASVALYKKLYEEAHKLRSSSPLPKEAATGEGRQDITVPVEDSHESLLNAHQKAHERVKYLEEELGKSRSEIMSLRSEGDKLALEARIAQEKLERFVKEFDHQRDQHNSLIARNVEFSQLIIDHQRKLRESSESLNAAEELSRKLTMEISLLKQEKEILLNSEKRATDEIRSLSERTHRLQASLDTIHSTEEVREEARCTERRKQELYIKQIEKEWAEAKRELHEERDKVRRLALERENGLNNALKQVEETGKELSKALHALAAAEVRASVAEARCSDLEDKIKLIHVEASEKNGKGGPTSADNNEIVLNLHNAKEEIEKLGEEAQINKDHMLQYKSIAQANEEALKQLEVAYEKSKEEAEIMKKSLDSELLYLREMVNELQGIVEMKRNEVAVVTAGKEEAVAAALLEITSLKESYSFKMSEIAVLQTQISSLKEEMEKESKKASVAQANYERQVILQSDTIQELNRTSQAFAELQEEASELRKSIVALKTENNDLKAKWETEKTMLEVLKNDADGKYNEVNELNKVLHSRLEALYIKLAEKDSHSSGVSGSVSHSSLDEDDGLQNVVKYLRRSKEIAEAEISLLKQERLRLQSQLETALKAAETAQASLNTERRNSKALFFSEEEFKSLQLQVQIVREISLLRESNMQLREENRHNFEECQKLREAFEKATTETEYLERGLGEKQNEVQACRKEIEKQTMEKEDLKKKVDELLERSKNLDVEEFDRMKEAVKQMQVNLGEKDTQLEYTKRLLSERQDAISRLEQDVSRSKLEISEKDSRVNDLLLIEASLKSDIEKQRKIIAQLKKKYENLLKEKEDLSKENQVLSKQLEDAKQGKRTVGEAVGEQTMKEKEKEKEKDTRIQTLEKAVERLRDELKKEKDEYKTEKGKRLKMQKTIGDSFETVSQQRLKLSDELEKHKQGLRMLADDVEKLKPGKGSQGSTEIQFLSGTLLEDLATAYRLAVENFQQAAQPVFVESVAYAVESSSTLDATSTGNTVGQVASAMVQGTSSPAFSTANLPSAKAVDDNEKKLSLLKQNLEPRKSGRKLVRPRILKPEESQGDVELLEAEGSDTSAKPFSSNSMETQGNLILQAPPLGCKRPSALTNSELDEELLVAEESTEPSLKKFKNSETPQDVDEGLAIESNDGPAAAKLEDSFEVLPASEEYLENNADLSRGFRDASADAGIDEIVTAGKLTDEPAAAVKRQEECKGDKGAVADEYFNVHVPVRNHAEQDLEQPAAESGSEREEGELVTDTADLEGGGGMSNATTGSPELGELQFEHGTTPEILPGVDDDSLNQAAIEVGEAGTPQTLDDDKNDEGVMTEDTGESSYKLIENVEQASVETDEVSEASTTNPEKISTSAAVESVVSEQGGIGIPIDTEEGRQVSPFNRSSTTINLPLRAKERASIRQAGMLSSLTSRGRGRAPRGRGGRSSRGQASGKQG